jgi:large subunit ribosomal protein L18
MAISAKKEKRIRRHRRVRAKVSGTAEVPRLSVFKSARHIYAQLINDEKGQTILRISDFEIKKPKTKKTETKKTKEEKKLAGKTAVAYEVGKLVAKKSLEKKIKKVIFDRGGFAYHGRIKALAEGARGEGLKF